MQQVNQEVINFSSLDDIIDFVNQMEKFSGPIRLVDQYTCIDAKSLLGVIAVCDKNSLHVEMNQI